MHLQDPRGQATACCKLGVLYQQQGQLEQAVGYFERFFELARSLGEHLLYECSMPQVQYAVTVNGNRGHAAWPQVQYAVAVTRCWQCCNSVQADAQRRHHHDATT
jgi:tetratricopeptide (TPR) repeat protein